MSWIIIIAAIVTIWWFMPRRQKLGSTDQGHGGLYSSASWFAVKPLNRAPKFVPANHTSPVEVFVDQLDRVIQPGHVSKVKN